VKVYVGRNGSARWAVILKGLPWGLNDNAIRAVLQTTFKPALKSGEPVDCWKEVVVKFIPKALILCPGRPVGQSPGRVLCSRESYSDCFGDCATDRLTWSESTG
jgi:hypothetical protein